MVFNKNSKMSFKILGYSPSKKKLEYSIRIIDNPIKFDDIRKVMIILNFCKMMNFGEFCSVFYTFWNPTKIYKILMDMSQSLVKSPRFCEIVYQLWLYVELKSTMIFKISWFIINMLKSESNTLLLVWTDEAQSTELSEHS